MNWYLVVARLLAETEQVYKETAELSQRNDYSDDPRSLIDLMQAMIRASEANILRAIASSLNEGLIAELPRPSIED